MNIDETIGALVHQQMWRARVSQVQLAGALSLDQAAVSRRLRGKTPWKASEVMAAAALLGVDVSTLYPRSPETEPATTRAAGEPTLPFVHGGYSDLTARLGRLGHVTDLRVRLGQLSPCSEAS